MVGREKWKGKGKGEGKRRERGREKVGERIENWRARDRDGEAG